MRFRAIKAGQATDGSAWRLAPLMNGWRNAGPRARAPAYRIDGRGRVLLRGIVMGGVWGTPALTLPEGFRPARPWPPAHRQNPFNRVEVAANGDVIPLEPTKWSPASEAFVLDGFAFFARKEATGGR